VLGRAGATCCFAKVAFVAWMLRETRAQLRGARGGTAQPPRLPEPLMVKRRVSVRRAIMIGGQRIQVGLPHAGKTAASPSTPIPTRSAWKYGITLAAIAGA